MYVPNKKSLLNPSHLLPMHNILKKRNINNALRTLKISFPSYSSLTFNKKFRPQCAKIISFIQERLQTTWSVFRTGFGCMSGA